MDFFSCQVSQLALNSKASDFGGFSIGYIQSINSELTDSQISFPVQCGHFFAVIPDHHI